MLLLDNSRPRQVKPPNLERNEGGVDNGSYDNDGSNAPAFTANDTIYHGVCEHTHMLQGIFCSKNPCTAKMKLVPAGPMLSGEMYLAGQKRTQDSMEKPLEQLWRFKYACSLKCGCLKLMTV